jgi:hypothetical protein
MCIVSSLYILLDCNEQICLCFPVDPEVSTLHLSVPIMYSQKLPSHWMIVFLHEVWENLLLNSCTSCTCTCILFPSVQTEIAIAK